MAKDEIERIKKTLEELGISQPTMAEKILVSKDYVNQVLNGRVKASNRVLIKMRTFINQEKNK